MAKHDMAQHDAEQRFQCDSRIITVGQKTAYARGAGPHCLLMTLSIGLATKSIIQFDHHRAGRIERRPLHSDPRNPC